ncbi:MAG: hypothetical protein RL685_6265 [Pseudomonadota bacterium]|jgi:hypothetical protein
MTLPTRSTPRRSRISHFKTPFVVAVLAPVAVLEMGCGGRAGEPEGPLLGSGGTTQTSSTTTTEPNGNPPPRASSTATCPAERPLLGSACTGQIETVCGYAPLPVCATGIHCRDGTWQYTGDGACNPPWVFGGERCPETLPEFGTSCSAAPSGVECEYEYCGGTAPLARCSTQTVLWEPIHLFACNPPRPVESYCPAQMPEHGSDCSTQGRLCYYEGCEGLSDTATCNHGQWSVQYQPGAACNPPFVLTPVCPSVEPVAGNDCAFEDQQCPYGSCGSVEDPGRTATCSSGTWQQLETPCFVSADAGVDGGG